MRVFENISLQPYNTFGIDVKAQQLVEIEHEDEVAQALEHPAERLLVLGRGSNILFTSDFQGTVLYICHKGIHILEEDSAGVLVRVSAGELWHDFVKWAVGRHLGGVENLALIPGKVGAAPVQNIGAYGREVKDVLYACTAIDRRSLDRRYYLNKDCGFGYRDSIFKGARKDKDIILSVDFLLQKPPHTLTLGYGHLAAALDAKSIKTPSIENVMKAVIDIRTAKIPDFRKVGNAGSFFKNPSVGRAGLNQLLEKYPGMPHYSAQSPDTFKLSAGWLIEKAGFKGRAFGNAGVYDKQALVLVNLGRANGTEIAALAERIRASVFELFGVALQPEVSII